MSPDNPAGSASGPSYRESWRAIERRDSRRRRVAGLLGPRCAETIRAVLPDYWMERPPLSMDRSTHSAIEEFLSLGQPGGADGPLDVGPILDARGDVTPWQFLCGVAERHEVAFHGTGDPTIESFEPPRTHRLRTVRCAEGGLCDDRPDLGDVLRDRGPRSLPTDAQQRLHPADGRRRSASLLLDHGRCPPRATVANGLRLFPAGGDVRRATSGNIRGPAARILSSRARSR